MSRKALRKSLNDICHKYAEKGTLEDFEIEWLIEHCCDFMNGLHRVENFVRLAFGEIPWEEEHETKSE